MSARLAFRAKQGDPTVWAASRFESFERYIATTLDQTGRVRLKLLSALGVGTAVTERQLASVTNRQNLLKDDFKTLEQVEQQLLMYERDMRRDFELRMADVENILLATVSPPTVDLSGRKERN